jgi:ABC-type multidrug transport system ATPase subunit
MSLEKNILININKSGDKNKLNQLISDFKIDYLKSKNAKKFSGGEKQKLSLARFMIREYKISIFDEVTSAMDTNSIRMAENNILKYFNNEYDTEGITNKIIIVITHDLEQAKRLTNNILLVKNKNIVTYE